MTDILLKPGREASVRRFHPWVFSGAIKRIEGKPADGEIVRVCMADGTYLATGHYQEASITVRIIDREEKDIDQAFWTEKMVAAHQYRKRLGLADNRSTNCYRLVHAEGDGLPGLVVDIYDNAAVVQCHSIGMHLCRHQIAQALQDVFGSGLDTIYDKSAESLPKRYAEGAETGFLLGNASGTVVNEHGHHFEVDWVTGQKTGFFLDQRENRALFARYAAGKTVLNAFCYSGGFSIYALNAGAARVDSVDVSQKAINMAVRNAELNQAAPGRHEAFAKDVQKFLVATDRNYELMVVDPPAFAKNIKKRHNAVQGYKRLNASAMRQVAKGGIMFTFSCSQVVDESLFYNTIVAAALEAGRQVRVMHKLSQPPDHPVHIFHPEGAYLKGLVLEIG